MHRRCDHLGGVVLLLDGDQQFAFQLMIMESMFCSVHDRNTLQNQQ